MAEIKSTMQLVMERAARIGKASDEDLRQDDARKKGMLFIGEYLDGSLNSLADCLQSQDSGVQIAVRSGMLESLMRNIFLPRDDVQQDRTEKATRGILELGGSAGDIVPVCQEMQRVLGGYVQHREQLRHQLEEQIRMQYEQLLAQQGGGQHEGMKIDPTLQPKFREEWGRIEAELTFKYNEALDQYKMKLKQCLGM